MVSGWPSIAAHRLSVGDQDIEEQQMGGALSAEKAPMPTHVTTRCVLRFEAAPGTE
jgi:hypothetical protein